MENFTKDKRYVTEGKKYRTCVLEFYDHSSGVIRDLDSALLCHAVGWLWKEDKLSYYLVTWVSGGNMSDPENNDCFQILKSAVIKKTFI